MKYCSKCGKELFDEAVVCPGSGCAVGGNSPAQFNNKNTTIQSESPTLANCSIAFAILMPIVGLILGIIGTIKYTDETLKKKSIKAIIASILIWAGLFLFLMSTGVFTDDSYYYLFTFM